MTGEPGERIAFFDAFRALTVFAVVSLHAAMTYMTHVPPWWYVINPERSLAFLVWVLLADTFPMPVLFFVSGYFALPSLEKRGKGDFLRDKTLRIGLPWAVGVLAFAPLFAWATWTSLGLPLPDGYGRFLTTIWLGPGYQQAHFWFLGVLLSFFLLFAAVSSRQGRFASGFKLRPEVVLALWWTLATASFFLSSLRWDPNLWIPLGPLYFQPARIVSYLAAFWLGTLAWRNREQWLRDEPGGKSLFLSALAALTGQGAVLAAAFIFPVKEGLLPKAVLAAAHNWGALSMGLFLFLLCRTFAGHPSRQWRRWGEASYGVYWLHQMILMPLTAFLLPFDLPPAVKFALALVGAWGISSALTERVLRRLPLMRRIF